MKRLIVIVLVLAALLAPVEVTAVLWDPCHAERLPAGHEQDRLERLVFGDMNVLVLKPPSYASTNRRYPVLYLLHGGRQTADSWVLHTGLIGYTEQLSEDSQAIVVLPDGGLYGAWTDWPDGSAAWETQHIAMLVPYIDAHYRTIADRSHRAIAGLSGGGLGAMLYTARHPELFGSAAGFSGLLDVTSPSGKFILHSAWFGNSMFCGLSPTPTGPWGDAVTNELEWHAHNPVDLAMNLRGAYVYLAVGDGVPCDEEDVRTLPNGDPTTFLEPAVHEHTVSFEGAVKEAGVEHETNYGCGIHSSRYWDSHLRDFWPRMVEHFGSAPPDSFDFRSAGEHFSPWGWSFVVDPERAPEFLDITEASRDGVTLTGSGRTAVTTAPLFRPLERILVRTDGAAPAELRADRSGRLCFEVDLGPPHSAQQYTPEAHAAAITDDGYWQTRTLTFEPDSPPHVGSGNVHTDCDRGSA